MSNQPQPPHKRIAELERQRRALLRENNELRVEREACRVVMDVLWRTVEERA